MPTPVTTRLRTFALLAFALGLLSGSCSNATGPDARFAPLEFRAPIRAMFPGMEDTLIAVTYGRELRPDQGEWSSSDAEVVRVVPGGVVTALKTGEAFIKLELEEAADSLRITVVTPPEGQIAFGGKREFDDLPGLWLMSADGSNLRQVWTMQEGPHGERRGTAGNPSFSPDGCSIVFQATLTTEFTPRLRRYDLQTGVTVVLTSGGSGPPAWAPDGERIVYSGLAPTGFELISIRPDGSDKVQLTDFLGAPLAFSADFFPDSRRLAIGMAVSDDGPLHADLFRLDLESRALSPILSRPLIDETDPSVSPDGSVIAFAGPISAAVHEWAVQLLGPDSSVTLVTQPSRVMVGETSPEGVPAYAIHPAFSGDGGWLAFEWNRDRRGLRLEIDEKGALYQVTNTLGEIYVIRTDGTLPVRLTHFAWAHSPDWGPTCPASSP